MRLSSNTTLSRPNPRCPASDAASWLTPSMRQPSPAIAHVWWSTRGREALAQEPLGDRHADGVGEALPERSRRDLDTRGVPGLGVAGRARPEGPERLEVVELEAVAAQVQHRVLQDRRMAVGQHEAVAVGPLRVGRVVAHDPAVEHVGERSERHRRALVPALGVQRRVHRHATDKGDRGRFEIGGERCRHHLRPYSGGRPDRAPSQGNTLRCDMSGPVRPVDVDDVDDRGRRRSGAARARADARP